MSDQELNDLDGLAESAIDVLQQHAVDNGLPASYELARIYSSEDDYIARQYPVRKAYASDKIRVAKKEQVSHAGDDGWGMLIPAQVTASPVPQQHKQSDQLASNPSIVANVYAREQSTSQIQQAKASEPAAEDGWDSWQAKTERNDAFERRAAMQPGSSSSSSTFTDVKAGDRSVKNERADRSMEASQAGNSSQLSPLPKVNGWIGSQNMDALRLAQRDGWKDYQEKAPTVLVAPKESDSHFSPLATPQRPSANLVHVPTSSGLPENMAPNNSARTTGWGPYEKYNPRTRSSQKEVSASRDANGISSPLHKRTGSGLGMEDEYPMLPGTTSGVPFRQNESIRPASRLATWEDWKPSRHDDGETAYRNRMHTKPASPTARRTLSYKQAIPETTAAIVPEPTSSRISTEVPGDKSDVRRDALQPCQPPKETQQDENPWSRWTASIAADKQGEQNFARRAAMSREDYMPERLMPSNSLPTLPRASLLPYAQNQPPGQASSVQTAPATTDNDGWANYTPKISAEQQGKEAFERRRAMGNAKYAGRNGIPASESASSTSSTGSAFRTRFGGQESKTLSIAGRADRESSTRAAKEARLAAYKEFQNGSSTLAKNFRSLKIAGSASRAAAAHSNQPESSGQTRPSYTSAPSRILPHSAYDTPIRQPHGPSSNAGQSPEGFNQISRHRKASPSRASGANPSYAGTYTSLPNGQTQQHANGHSSNNASQPPSGGIGWD